MGATGQGVDGGVPVALPLHTSINFSKRFIMVRVTPDPQPIPGSSGASQEHGRESPVQTQGFRRKPEN